MAVPSSQHLQGGRKGEVKVIAETSFFEAGI